MEKREQNHELTIENVKQMLSTMNYGSITLVIQDNVVVQIERNEKIRLK
ncbi:YezD family protein [Sporosarcina sp. E16_8]|nr:YezD family protein [Sporosarcina sp. E16_8]MBO0586989.1 YezD family protein [Sporosarcina sp. E16_8]